MDEVIQQSGRHAAIRQQIRLGTVSYEEATITQNQIRHALIELLNDIDTQAKRPNIQTEIQAAISIMQSKNVLVNTTIQAGGDVHVGDRTIVTESDTSKRLRLWLFLLVPILALGGVWLWGQYQQALQPFNLNVLLENRSSNPHLPKPNGTLTIIYGGNPKSIDNISSSHVFQGIPSNYKTAPIRLQYQADGFWPIDTTITNAATVSLPLKRNDDD